MRTMNIPSLQMKKEQDLLLEERGGSYSLMVLSRKVGSVPCS
jgi:hypothetical protein